MKILYDHQIFWKQKYGGISRYYVNLINALLKNNIDIEIISPIYRNKYLHQLPAKIIKGTYLKRKPIFLGWLINYLNKRILLHNIKKKSDCIFHSTYYDCDLDKNYKNKHVITIFDTIHELRRNDPNFLPKKKILEKADKIICISDVTKNNLINIYNQDPDKLETIHLGFDHIIYDQLLSFTHKRPFLLFVGSREKYKNFLYFIEQFSKSSQLMRNFDIILFGGGNITDNENQKLNFLGYQKNQIKHYEGSDQFLFTLYKKAEIFIFPSMFEGFGIPLIEAQACGCPILASDIDTFREICGDSVLYFDLSIKDDLIHKLEEILYSSDLKAKIKSKGQLNHSKYTWDNCAKKTIALYKNL